MKVAAMVLAVTVMMVFYSASIVKADCPDYQWTCFKGGNAGQEKGNFSMGTCWEGDWHNKECKPCPSDDWKAPARECNSRFSACQNDCWACYPGAYGAWVCRNRDGDPVTVR